MVKFFAGVRDMGAGQSTSYGRTWTENPFTGTRRAQAHSRARSRLMRPGVFTQSRCRNKPAYVDPRGFALKEIYKVRDLSRYPPTVYTLAMAQEDLRACAAGRDLPHHDKVVKYDKIAGWRGPRVYALVKYHGYTEAEAAAALRLLPYSDKDAQVNISHFQRKGVPYYKVVKQAAMVIDSKRGSVRDWRHKGFDDGYKYDVTDPTGAKARVGRLGGRVQNRVNVTKYPLKKLRSGQWAHMVPCALMPGMCGPGMKEFPHLVSANQRRAQAGLQLAQLKQAKHAQRRALAEHSRKMAQLRRRLGAAKNNANKTKTLRNQMNYARQSLRAARGQGPVPTRPAIPAKKPTARSPVPTAPPAPFGNSAMVA